MRYEVGFPRDSPPCRLKRVQRKNQSKKVKRKSVGRLPMR